MRLRRCCDTDPVLKTGVQIGLHLEAVGGRPGPTAHEIALQAERFERLFGRPPDHLDGHHHCHAASGAAPHVEKLARRLAIRVRSIDPDHRVRLRAAGISTPDRLVGRLRPTEPAIPATITALEAGRRRPAGATEWMVHPGYADPAGGSRYDAAREEDLREVLRLSGNAALRALRP